MKLEEEFETIQAEYFAYVQKLISRRDWDELNTTPALSDVGGRDGALHDVGLCKSGRWQEAPLFCNGRKNLEYAEHFPETCRILEDYFPDATGLAYCGGGDVIFSVITPGTRLRPHCGPSNSRTTCHLGVKIPQTDALWMRVGDEKRAWTEGKCTLFDDSYEHEVVFEDRPKERYPGERVVLLVNFWHPDFEYKNYPDWRERSDEAMRTYQIETLPQMAVTSVLPNPVVPGGGS